jgi:phosphatidylserine/phosphatidylglycerophosphate/cardiolipin synthase-like enzyme
MALELDSLKLFMGPSELGAPDDLEQAIVGFIEGADQPRSRLLIAVQELESEPITRAILAAKARGVTVRIVLEGDYLRATRGDPEPFVERGSHEPNRRMLNALLRAGIEVRTDYNAKIFHQKFIVRRRLGGDMALLTGSTNFTPTGCHANLNHIAVFENKTIAKEYEAEFDEIWGGTFGTNRLRHEPAPREGTVSKVSYKLLFAPDHAPEMEIMKQMLKAQRRVDFAIFTFAGSSGIDDTMIALQRGGIPIRGVLDRAQGVQKWAATKAIQAAGADLRGARKGSRFNGNRLNKLHHKLMVIDERVVVGGSFNYTAPANQLNDENIFVLGDLENDDPVTVERENRVGAFALGEIDRIFETFGEEI